MYIMSFGFYTGLDFHQLIPFYLCAKCGRVVKFNEICECESIFIDIQRRKKNDDGDDYAFERPDKTELTTSHEDQPPAPEEA